MEDLPFLLLQPVMILNQQVHPNQPLPKATKDSPFVVRGRVVSTLLPARKGLDVGETGISVSLVESCTCVRSSQQKALEWPWFLVVEFPLSYASSYFPF